MPSLKIFLTAAILTSAFCYAEDEDPDSYVGCENAYVTDIVPCQTTICYAAAFGKMVTCQKTVLIKSDPTYTPREMHVDGDLKAAMNEEVRTRIKKQIRNKYKHASKD